ncbi:MAG: AzlC family ABC transporter permease [Parasporobacterium sp.]|nr:AzlC family ABC transporter permease [Parasporobacterium sp.]
MKAKSASKENKAAFKKGLKAGIPIGIGYFAVAFSLGIAAKNSGLTPLEAGFASFLCNASAGEYVGFALIGAGASYLEMFLMSFIANARYFLMSCAMSQKLKPGTKLIHRLLIGYGLTDEIFAVGISQIGYANPFVNYGAIIVAGPCWWAGTFLGAFAGALLPGRVVSALSVALFGMFIAIIIPPAKKDKIIAGIIVVCFALSSAATYLPYIRDLSEGTRTIILTVVISALAAIIFPRKDLDTEGVNET